jgi:hypothetical protein
MTMTNKTKPKGRPFKKFYCDRDEIFLLPPLAFKLWMFYYRLESRKREGWASRETICEKCAMNKDTVSKWRKWLVANGWMKQVGTHNTGSEFGIPVMQVTRGVPKAMPRPGRKKGHNPRLKQSVTATTETIGHRSALKQSVTGRTETISHGRTETISRNVDVNPEVDKPDVDGPVKRPEGSGSSRESQAKLPDGFEWRDGKAVQIGGAR